MKILNKILKILLTLAIFAVTFIVFLMIVGLVTKLIVGKDYLFYEYTPIATFSLEILTIFPPLIITIFVATKFKLISSMKKAEKNEEIIYFWNRLGNFRYLVIAIYFIVLFCMISSVNVVFEDKIVTKSVFNLKGTEYRYEQVEEINCGFGNSNFTFLHYNEKGSFYYQVKLNGKTLTFSKQTVNSNNKLLNENSYLELEEFDKKLVSLKITKTSSENGAEYCDFDKEYKDRFLRIIRNK